ncbi:MAG TPA: hypothetical protein VLB76_13645 [Thermoanaerobaculia bacterium]|nr:hypothetical protein [Thermoanaerobaculia bacterium]
MHRDKKWLLKAAITPLIFVVYAFLAAGTDTSTSDANCEISNLAGEPDVGFINDAADAGYKVSLTVTNVGKSGTIRVAPWLSSSEGEWKREQNLPFEAGASRNFEFFFNEPTINATNIHYGCNCTP